MALLGGFGIAQQPNLFGKMLKRSPFMFYVNPPKISDEDLSHIVDVDVSTTASGFVAYGALKVLQLLKAQNFPDLDKIVRTQPSLLLVDSSEVSARANFLVNLFIENTPAVVDTAVREMDLSVSDEVLDLVLGTATKTTTATTGTKTVSSKSLKNKSKNGIITSQVVLATQPSQASSQSLNVVSVGNLRPWDIKTNSEHSVDSTDILMNQNQHAAHDMLGALLLTYPAVLSINHQ